MRDRRVADQLVEQSQRTDLVDVAVQQPLGLQAVGGGDDERRDVIRVEIRAEQRPRPAGL